MRKADSIIIGMADINKLPAGGPLAVDRDNFSKSVSSALKNHPLVEVNYTELKKLPIKNGRIPLSPLAL